MKVLLLAPGSVIHTQRWANGLVAQGVAVVCASQHDFIGHGWDARVQRERLPHDGPGGYFLNGRAVARLHAQTGCDLVNAHYATGYGTLATGSGVRPLVLSVWGSDVYDFPRSSPLHRWWLARTLCRADAIASTSVAMARQVETLLAGRAHGPIVVTPFGVDTEAFAPAAGAAPERGGLVVGTVKTLAPKYGIDTLLRAFRLLVDRGVEVERLVIAGDGPDRASLEALARTLGIDARVRFVGPVPHAEVPSVLRGLDIFVAASRLDSESFGVAVVEASACGLPVVVSRVGGLPEVVDDGVTGFVVEKESSERLADAIGRLAADPALRRRMGAAGRARVLERYRFADNVATMIEACRRVAGSTIA